MDTQNNGGIIVSNALYYSRRLPEVSSSAAARCGSRSLDALSKLEAVALAKELCEAAVSSLGSPCSRLLFCPLCTQSFGYSYGLECHLLSVHHDELLTNRPHRDVGSFTAVSSDFKTLYFSGRLYKYARKQEKEGEG